MSEIDQLISKAKEKLNKALSIYEEYIMLVIEIMKKISEEIRKCGYTAKPYMSSTLGGSNVICVLVDNEINECLERILEKYGNLIDILVYIEVVRDMDECMITPSHVEVQ